MIVQIDTSFKLPLPDSYVFTLNKYRPSHSHLEIRADQCETQKTFYLIFGDVAYFSGPTFCDGSSISIAPESELTTLIEKINLRPELREDLVYFRISTFIVENEVRILAKRGIFSDQPSKP